MFDAKVLFEQILELRDNPGAFRELRGQEFEVQRDRKMLFPSDQTCTSWMSVTCGRGIPARDLVSPSRDVLR